MTGYSLAYWILFFFIYCFLGWCIESTIVSVDTKKLTNRGFLNGPVIPIYGFGAIMIIFCTLPFSGNFVLEYIVGVVSCTVLEYFTGVLMELIFKTKYWDYSGKFMNFQGRVCLISSLFWGILSLFVIKVIHIPMADFITTHIGLSIAVALDIVFAAVMLTDTVFSVKAAFELSKIVAKLEAVNVQLELAKMEARDILAVKLEDMERRKDEIMDRLADSNQELRDRIGDLVKGRDEIIKSMGAGVRSMVRNNPSAVHKRFAKGYADLKERLRR